MHPSEILEKHREKCLKELTAVLRGGEVTQRSEDQGEGTRGLTIKLAHRTQEETASQIEW